MEKTCRIILKIIIILIIIQLIHMPTSQASFWGDIFKSGDEFLNDGKNQGVALGEDDMKEGIGKIFNILVALGTILSVLVGAILGIKFMFGSLEEKAEIKEILIPYILGCIVIFGAFGIWKLVIMVLNSVT